MKGFAGFVVMVAGMVTYGLVWAEEIVFGSNGQTLVALAIAGAGIGVGLFTALGINN